jgi:hypothetical protein
MTKFSISTQSAKMEFCLSEKMGLRAGLAGFSGEFGFKSKVSGLLDFQEKQF